MKIRFISLLLGSCLLLNSCFVTTKNDLADYTEKRTNYSYDFSVIAPQVMPDLNDLPPYKKIYYQYRHNIQFALLSTETMLLVVTYNEETYRNEKSKGDAYQYLKEAVYKEEWDAYLLPEPEFQIGSFHFKVLEANENNNFNYPHNIGIIAMSDEKKSIAYLYFHDFSLDYIGEHKVEGEMVKLVKKYFRYKW